MSKVYTLDGKPQRSETEIVMVAACTDSVPDFLVTITSKQHVITEHPSCTYPFSSRSSLPRNQTGDSCIAGRFFTSCPVPSLHGK